MNRTRRDFIGKTVTTLTVSTSVDFLAGQATAGDEGQAFFLRLLKSSNQSVATMLQSADAGRQTGGGRSVGRGANIAALVAAYCAPESSYYRAERLIPLME